jgi:hypothetical protein
VIGASVINNHPALLHSLPVIDRLFLDLTPLSLGRAYLDTTNERPGNFNTLAPYPLGFQWWKLTRNRARVLDWSSAMSMIIR